MVLLLFFMFIFGIFEAGRIMQVQQSLARAAWEGARRGVVPFTRTSTLATTPDVEGVVKSRLVSASLDPNQATVTVERGTLVAGSTTQYTRVTVAYPYRVMTLGMFGMLNMTLHGTSMMRNETSLEP